MWDKITSFYPSLVKIFCWVSPILGAIVADTRHLEFNGQICFNLHWPIQLNPVMGPKPWTMVEQSKRREVSNFKSTPFQLNWIYLLKNPLATFLFHSWIHAYGNILPSPVPVLSYFNTLNTKNIAHNMTTENGEYRLCFEKRYQRSHPNVWAMEFPLWVFCR